MPRVYLGQGDLYHALFWHGEVIAQALRGVRQQPAYIIRYHRTHAETLCSKDSAAPEDTVAVTTAAVKRRGTGTHRSRFALQLVATALNPVAVLS